MRKLLIIAFSCTAILLAGYVGYRGYKVWKQKHLVSMARDFIAKSNGTNALLTLKQALLTNPRNLEATRMMADLAAATRSPAVLVWRSRVVELDPNSTDDRLLLASTALGMQDLTTATNALNGVSETDRKTFSYQNLAGNVAARVNRLAEADQYFVEAARLQPTNPAPRLSLAVLRLQGTNTQALAEARAILTRLRVDPMVGAQALRELVGDAIRQSRTNDAVALSRELVARTNSLFSDRLLRLDILLATRDREFKPTLASYQKDATNALGPIHDLATWQASRIGPAEALGWLRTLPMAVQTNQAMALLTVECQLSSKDWRGAQTSLQGRNWGELEFLRHAMLARAMQGQNLATSAKTEWDQALKQASANKQPLLMLLRLCDASQWNWPNERGDILQTIITRFPSEKWAVGLLGQSLFAEGRTRSLLSLFTQQAKAAPADLSVKNNLAMTALLLDAKELKPHDLAREAYEKSPTNGSYASTYALSLYLQQKPADALKLMQQIPPPELESPSIAGYYGLVLQATGDRAKAAKYFDIAFKGSLLPEERKLMETARQKL